MSTKKREYGLDLYRILAMVLITGLHVVNQHYRMLENSNTSTQCAFGYLVEYACFCGVDCFALLSGFLLAGAQWEYDSRWLQRVGNLWIKMLVWGFGVWASLLLMQRFGLHLQHPLSLKRTILLLCPMTHGWWYINAYMGLLLLLPLLMRGLCTLTQKELSRVGCILLAGFSFIPVFSLSSGGMALGGGIPQSGWPYASYGAMP